MSLEDLEKKLYGLGKNQNETNKPVSKNQGEAKKEEIRSEWEIQKAASESGEQVRQASRFSEKFGIFTKTIFWLSVVLIVAGAGFAYYFVSQYYKSRDLNFEVEASSKAIIAQPFEIAVNLENKSQSVLRDPKIMIKLPEGVISLDKNPDMQIIEEGLSDINPGSLVKRKFKIVIVEGEQSIKKFDVGFSYMPPKLNTRFEQNKTIEISTGQPAIAVNLITPQKVFNREAFEIGVNYQNISDFNFQKSRLQLVIPSNFIFKEASVKPTLGTNVWNLGQIPPKSQSNIIIKGALEGPDQSFFEIKSQFFVSFNQKEYLISEKTASLSIASSPLSLSVVVNNDSNYIAKPGNDLAYQIKYRNNTEIGLNDVIVKAKLSGEMFDLASLQTPGFFDSKTNTILWNVANNPQFQLLPPGVEGALNFTIKTKDYYPIKRLFDKNFVLKIQAEINSPTVPYNVSSDKTVGFSNLETKVAGNVDILVSGDYVKGSYSPKVNQPTTYNIRWIIKNYSTNVKDVRMNGFLQSGVKWLNIVKSNIDAIPVYNERTGEVAWSIDKISATKGIISKPVEATFQVEATPNITQAGQAFIILGETLISAVDEFTGLQINNRVELLKTETNVVN